MTKYIRNLFLKTMYLVFVLFLFSCDNSIDDDIKYCSTSSTFTPPTTSTPTQASDLDVISPIAPDVLKHYCFDDSYYKKMTWVQQIPIVAPADVSTIALQNIAELVSKQIDNAYSLGTNAVSIPPYLLGKRFRIGVYPHGPEELTQQLPEFRQYPPAYGYGATDYLTMMAVSEREGAFGTGGATTVHEITHVLHLIGYNNVEASFEPDLAQAYNNAVRNNIWESGTYILTDMYEYLAEGSEMFFAYLPSYILPDLLDISPSKQLENRDPALHELLSRLYNKEQAVDLKSNLSFYKGTPSLYLQINSSSDPDLTEMDYIRRVRIEHKNSNGDPDPIYHVLPSVLFVPGTGIPGLLETSIPDPRTAVEFYTRDEYRFHYWIDEEVYALCVISKDDVIQQSEDSNIVDINSYCTF